MKFQQYVCKLFKRRFHIADRFVLLKNASTVATKFAKEGFVRSFQTIIDGKETMFMVMATDEGLSRLQQYGEDLLFVDATFNILVATNIQVWIF